MWALAGAQGPRPGLQPPNEQAEALGAGVTVMPPGRWPGATMPFPTADKAGALPDTGSELSL